jgi:hypothetical protein
MRREMKHENPNRRHTAGLTTDKFKIFKKYGKRN